jgi:hypothetical protein
MLYILSGAAASGKSTMIKLLKQELKNAECYDYDDIPVSTAEERCLAAEEWIKRAIKAQNEGKDFILATHSPLGELLACPSAIELIGISACLLDCNDFVRTDRYRARPQFEEWPLGQDTLCWAVFHRMHASEPDWEQRVIVKKDLSEHKWDRWTGWKKRDERWNVKIIDNSYLVDEECLSVLLEWIRLKKSEESHLSKESEWWK